MTTKVPPRRRGQQRGQSMTEFLVALVVLLPLFLAVTYAGRYSDIQFSAVQASRYAAFQRAMQPGGTPSDDKLRDQMRARFFLYGGRNDGRLRFDDTAVNAGDADTPPLWRDLGGSALLASPEDVSLSFAGTGNLYTGAAVVPAQFLNGMAFSAGKSNRPGTVAQVEVTLANKLDLSKDLPGPLKIAAATAAVGDGLGSSGSRGTRDAVVGSVPVALIPQLARDAVRAFMSLFEPAGPELGCIKPDVVPNHRLEPYSAPGGCL